ncbi:Oligopeptide-binding protein AppA [bioreactor metagenome]|uniref:Oligopeptide-binding protein AppA n=1 Tax=bioreactor metagenome TaxID=1076179 RepID=A0A645CM91_9ZZZZ
MTTPTLDKVVYTIIPDETTAYQAWLNDEVDEIYTYPETELATLEESGEYNFVNQLWPSPWYMAFNMDADYEGVISDINVRKAITMAIDNTQISTLATAGIFPASEYYIPVVYDYALNDDAKRPAYDPEAAIALLEASGYTRGDDGYFFTINIKPVTGMDDVATVIQAQLKEIGINVEIVSLEYAIWTEQVFTNHDYDLATLGGFQGPDILGTGRRWTTTGDINVLGYSNATVDALYEQAQSVSDLTELAAIFSQIQVELAKDMPYLLLVDYNQKTPYKKYISGHPAIDAIDKCGFSELTYVVLSE